LKNENEGNKEKENKHQKIEKDQNNEN